MSEIFISVDIEADGPIPGDYSMSSIGAVLCGYRSNSGLFAPEDVDAGMNNFYAELKPISDKFVPEAAAVSGLDRVALISGGETPQHAMVRFVDWVNDLRKQAGDSRAIFVGWPLSYDWLWTYWYLQQFAGESPFGFSGAYDMKTWFAARSGLPLNKFGKRDVYKAVGVQPRPHTHNALDDAKEQGELWQNLIDWRP